jgi:hypothetical protein
MVDKVGTEITVGCFIAYGHALGRSAALQFGRVEAVNVKTRKDPWDDKEYEDLTITVLGIEDFWQDWEGKERPPQVLMKRSTLLFPNRTIVIPTLPQKYLNALEKDCLGQGKKAHTWTKRGEYSKVCTECGREV